MSAIRILLAQRLCVVLICAAALVVKLLVPNGYMIVADQGRVAITLCSGTGPATTMAEMPGMHGAMPEHGHSANRGHVAMDDGAGNHGNAAEHGKAEMPCAFAGLMVAAVDAADPVQLAALIAFVMATGLVAFALPPTCGRTHLRPPLRGPPATL